MKFKALCAVCEESRAKELAEPEDQDYYGLGARSARFSLNLVIAIVYSSLCPMILVVTGINFLICRVLYGYLLVFAEGRKPDLGGVFWVTQLKHIQCGLFIYVVLMIGVLSARAPSLGPAIVASVALLYAIRSYFRFHSAFEWEVMPFQEFVTGEARKADNTPRSCSKQRLSPLSSRRVLGNSDTSYEQKELTQPILPSESGAS